MTIAAVLLAAGRGTRFGGEKLLADVGGRPMAAAAMDVLLGVRADMHLAVVSDARVAAMAKAHGIGAIVNDAPQQGLSRSIRIGLERAEACDAVLFAAADQPLLTSASLNRLLDAFRAHEGGLACLRDRTHEGNPAVFSRAFYPALRALEGDKGAKSILKANRERLLIVDCLLPDELSDADDPQTLRQILAQVVAIDAT